MISSSHLVPQPSSLTGTAPRSGGFRHGAVKVKFLAAAKSVALALALVGLTACDKKTDGKADEKGGAAPAKAAATKSGPARTEGKIEKAKLEEFSAFLPDEVNGWKKLPRLGYYSGDTQSTATATYRKDEGGAGCTIVITFSNKEVSVTKGIITDPRQATAWGFDVGTIAGYPALLGKAGTNTAGTPFVVVLSNSRSVQLMYDEKSALTVDMLRPIFEKVDLNGIADK